MNFKRREKVIELDFNGAIIPYGGRRKPIYIISYGFRRR